MNTDIRAKVLQVLDEFRIPTKPAGYAYLVDAITMTVQDPGVLKSMERLIYPVIAQRNGVSKFAVSQAIRHVIDEAFNDLSNELLWGTFGRYVSYNTGDIGLKPFLKVCVKLTNKRLGADSIDVRADTIKG